MMKKLKKTKSHADEFEFDSEADQNRVNLIKLGGGNVDQISKLPFVVHMLY